MGDWAADRAFEGPNDLVVDTASMAKLTDGRAVQVAHDFGTSDRMHHTNYVVPPKTALAIRSSLGIGSVAKA